MSIRILYTTAKSVMFDFFAKIPRIRKPVDDKPKRLDSMFEAMVVSKSFIVPVMGTRIFLN